MYDDKAKKVQHNFYDLIELASSNAEKLFKLCICIAFEKESIPLSNIIGFTADTTNVMFGEHNSVASHLKESPTYLSYAMYMSQCIT